MNKTNASMINKTDFEYWMVTTIKEYASAPARGGGCKRLQVFIQPDGYRYQVVLDLHGIGKGLCSARHRTIDRAIDNYNDL